VTDPLPTISAPRYSEIACIREQVCGVARAFNRSGTGVLTSAVNYTSESLEIVLLPTS